MQIKNVWPFQKAKAKFTQIIRKALQEGPQTISKSGQDAVVILSLRDYQRLSRPPEDMVTFFKNSPLYGLDLDLERSRDQGREVVL